MYVGSTNLFQLGRFILHSGQVSNFKIECNAFTRDDWITLATLIAERHKFCEVEGVPRGGLELANQLVPFISPATSLQLGSALGLVVDDVWTTGDSMGPWLDKGFLGYVVFARSPIFDPRVKALFTLDAKSSAVMD